MFDDEERDEALRTAYSYIKKGDYDNLAKLFKTNPYLISRKRKGDFLKKGKFSTKSKASMLCLERLFESWWEEAVATLDFEMIDNFNNPINPKGVDARRDEFYANPDMSSLPDGWWRRAPMGNRMLVHLHGSPKIDYFVRQIEKKDLNVQLFILELERLNVTNEERFNIFKSADFFYSWIHFFNTIEFEPMLIGLLETMDSSDKKTLITRFATGLSHPYYLSCFVNLSGLSSQEIYSALTQDGNVSNRIKTYVDDYSKKYQWLDEGGQLINYFQMGNGLIKSKNDYCLVLDLYIKEHLSVSKFCKKYRIDNIEGFEQAIERRCLDDPEFKKSSEAMRKNVATNYYHSTTNLIIQSIKSEEYFAKALNSGGFRSPNTISRILQICDSMRENQEINLREKFLRRVITYFLKRLNSYKDYSADPSDIAKMLTRNEVEFLRDQEDSVILKYGTFGDEIDETEKLVKVLRGANYPQDQFYKAVSNRKDPRSIAHRFMAYNNRFRSSAYFKNKHLLLVEGNEFEVTRDDVNKALSVASTLGLFPSVRVIELCIKAIKQDENAFFDEAYLAMKKKKEEFITLLSEAKSLEEYISVIDNSREE